MRFTVRKTRPFAIEGQNWYTHWKRSLWIVSFSAFHYTLEMARHAARTAITEKMPLPSRRSPAGHY
jgi:hypothetical protein